MSSGHTSFAELQHLFGSAQSLPQVPQSPLRLTALLDEPDPSPREIEDLIHGDPALTAGVVKAASSAVFGRTKPATSVREAALVLGQRSLRSLSVAMWTNALVCNARHSSRLDLARFAKNGSFVGALANCLSRSASAGHSPDCWTAEEMFAAGVLHNVLFGLLSFADPSEFDRLYNLAEARATSLRHAFIAVHSRPVSDLAARASEALGLPGQFLTVSEHIENPAEAEGAAQSLAILNYARTIAEQDAQGLEAWAIAVEVPDHVAALFAPTPEQVSAAQEFARANLVLAA